MFRRSVKRFALVAIVAVAALLGGNASASADVVYGDYLVQPVHSAKCLDVIGGSGAQGTRIQQYDCLGYPWQIFQFNRVGWHGPYPVFEIKPRHTNYTMCLDVINGSITDGVEIQQWPCNGNGQQRWVQYPTGAARTYLYKPYHSVLQGAPRCLDVRHGSIFNGALLQIWTCNGYPQQNFYT